MRMQISDSSDTMVTAPTMAPSTKRIMHWRKNGGVERILGVPGKQHNSHALLDEYKVSESFGRFLKSVGLSVN